MSLAENRKEIERRIEEACRSVGRDRAEVTLVAVTKGMTADRIREAYELGVRDFGESRLQEALPKIEAIRDLSPLPPSTERTIRGGGIRWHFVGKLQSNKARKAAELFDVLHTLESESQLRELSQQDRTLDALIEVNIAEEPQKSGVLPAELPGFLKTVLQCPRVRFRGLVAVGPNLGDPEAMRPYFRRLRVLNDQAGGDWLSMGMSGDFHVAIQEGSSHVRVGTALYGVRT